LSPSPLRLHNARTIDDRHLVGDFCPIKILDSAYIIEVAIVVAATQVVGMGRRRRQTAFAFRTWGGRRRGAGRRPRGERAGVAHRRRPALSARHPVHVTWRMRDGSGNLRTGACVRFLRRAFLLASHARFQVVHHAILGNHIHLLVEAEDERALARGMQGLGIRIAKGIGRLRGHRGRALADRYHAHILATLAETLRARRYLLDNARRHFGMAGPDWCASQVALRTPRTWLLGVGQRGWSAAVGGEGEGER
jgi:REP element-mobilizing transposase RayT